MKKLILIITLLLLVNPSSAETTVFPTALSIGDEFQFEIIDYSLYYELNSSIHSPSLKYQSGDILNITVDNIQEHPDSLETTIVNVTTTTDTEDYSGFTYLGYYKSMESISSSSDFMVIMPFFTNYTSGINFSKVMDFIDIEDNDPIIYPFYKWNVENFVFPYFVDDNETMYTERSESITESNVSISESDIEYPFYANQTDNYYTITHDEISLFSQINTEEKTFKQYFRSFERWENSTYDWELAHGRIFEVELDYGRGIVTKFFYNLKYTRQVGSSYDVIDLKQGFKEYIPPVETSETTSDSTDNESDIFNLSAPPLILIITAIFTSRKILNKKSKLNNLGNQN